MPSRRIDTAVGALATSANILESDWIRFPGKPSMLTLAATVPAAGAGEVLMNVELGSDLVAKNLVVPAEAVAGSGPQIPYNLLVEEGVAASDQIIITFTDIGGTGRTVTTLVVVE